MRLEVCSCGENKASSAARQRETSRVYFISGEKRDFKIISTARFPCPERFIHLVMRRRCFCYFSYCMSWTDSPPKRKIYIICILDCTNCRLPLNIIRKLRTNNADSQRRFEHQLHNAVVECRSCFSHIYLCSHLAAFVWAPSCSAEIYLNVRSTATSTFCSRNERLNGKSSRRSAIKHCLCTNRPMVGARFGTAERRFHFNVRNDE